MSQARDPKASKNLAFADRFFERQRREIIGQLREEARRRRERRHGTLLAVAAVATVALALTVLVGQRSMTPTPTASTWLADLSIDPEASSPLAGFAELDGASGEGWTDLAADVDLRAVLPPLELSNAELALLDADGGDAWIAPDPFAAPDEIFGDTTGTGRREG